MKNVIVIGILGVIVFLVSYALTDLILGQPEPAVECLQGVFLEQFQPNVETYGTFSGYLCGENLGYVLGTPPGEVINTAPVLGGF